VYCITIAEMFEQVLPYLQTFVLFPLYQVDWKVIKRIQRKPKSTATSLVVAAQRVYLYFCCCAVLVFYGIVVLFALCDFCDYPVTY
jgi:hypothetical protein